MPRQNLKGASKAAIQRSRVEQLDNFGSNPAEYVQVSVKNAFESAVGQFIERVHNNINSEKNFVTTGAISNITIQSSENQLDVYGSKHLIYQDRGVNGSVKKLYDTPHSYTDKRPPISVFEDWIRTKNIQLRDNERYYGDASPFADLSDDQKIKSAAWAMSTKVFKEGFKPRYIYSKEIPQLIEDIKKNISTFTIQMINQVIDVKPSARRTIIRP